MGVSGNFVYGSWETGLATGFQDYRAYVVTPKQVLLTVPLLQVPLLRQLWHSRSLRDAARALRSFDLKLPFEPRRVRRPAPSVTGAFLSWQRRHQDRPFFAFLNYFDAHELGALPEADRQTFRGGRDWVDQYDGAIAYIDRHLGILFDSLAARGVLDNTLVIVTADHGEHFGERGLRSHGNSLYMSLLHVPLVMRLPGRVPSGRRIASVVSLRDIPATVLTLSGARGAALPGISLAQSWQEGGRPTSPAISEVERAAWPGSAEPVSRGAMRGVVWDGWHYILNGDGVEELYRWPEDAAEVSDLSQDRVGLTSLLEGRRRLGAVPGGYR